MDARSGVVTIPPLDAEGRPWERHLLKLRPGRREATFVGRTQLVEGRRLVVAGWIVKQVRPERAAALASRHDAITRALARPAVHLPRAPLLLERSVETGRFVFAAFAGIPLVGWRDGVARSARLDTSLCAVAALEHSPAAAWPSRRWTVVDEFEVLRRAAERAQRSLPQFASTLFDRLQDAQHRLGFAPAHRDLNEEQIVAAPGDPAAARPCWIDWDEAALAPRGLDAGNLLAHERLRALRAGSDPVDPPRAAYLAAGGSARGRDLDAWEAVACLRLSLLVQRADGVRNSEWVPLHESEASEVGRRARLLQSMAAVLLAR